MKRFLDPILELLGPIVLVVLVAIVGSQTTSAGNISRVAGLPRSKVPAGSLIRGDRSHPIRPSSAILLIGRTVV